MLCRVFRSERRAETYLYLADGFDFTDLPDQLKAHFPAPALVMHLKRTILPGLHGSGLMNAAQLQMVNTGKMHGYMRMYWCKKIYEWTLSAKKAMEFAIYLNDK